MIESGSIVFSYFATYQYQIIGLEAIQFFIFVYGVSIQGNSDLIGNSL
jgi:hypothetical protein